MQRLYAKKRIFIDITSRDGESKYRGDPPDKCIDRGGLVFFAVSVFEIEEPVDIILSFALFDLRDLCPAVENRQENAPESDIALKGRLSSLIAIDVFVFSGEKLLEKFFDRDAVNIRNVLSEIEAPEDGVLLYQLELVLGGGESELWVCP